VERAVRGDECRTADRSIALDVGRAAACLQKSPKPRSRHAPLRTLRSPGMSPDRPISDSLVNSTCASTSASMRETDSRRGDAPPIVDIAHAPPPRQAAQRARRAGAEITAACSSPSRSTASRVPKTGTPRM
jgi:hypothetical protein